MQNSYIRIAASIEHEYASSRWPDGRRIVFVKSAKLSYDASLMLQAANNESPRDLIALDAKITNILPSGPPDGQEIAFVQQVARRCIVACIGSPADSLER